MDDNGLGDVARVAKLDWIEEAAAAAKEEEAGTEEAAGMGTGEGAEAEAMTGKGTEATTGAEAHAVAAGAEARGAKGATGGGGGGGESWGTLAPGETFDFVFGSDLLYEALHAEVLPKVIKRRLAPDGRCRVVGAVRNRAMLDTLQAWLHTKS